MTSRSLRDGIAVAATVAAALLLALFFGFVGTMKSFAPLELLKQHHAWTTALPALPGRLVGLSELACAAALVLGLLLPGRRTWITVAAVILIVNQLVAAAVHLARGETEALPQNAILIGLLILAAAGARRWQTRIRDRARA